MQNLWGDNVLSDLIDKLCDDQSLRDQRREIEGHVRIYANRDAVEQAIHQCKPLSGLLDYNGGIWIAYRPKSEEYRNDMDWDKDTTRHWSRSALKLLKVQLNDQAGRRVSDLCWFAPLSTVPNDTITMSSPLELKDRVDQYLLLLPQLNDNGNGYQNFFHVIGSKWTERVSDGTFKTPNLAFENFNDDWQV